MYVAKAAFGVGLSSMDKVGRRKVPHHNPQSVVNLRLRRFDLEEEDCYYTADTLTEPRTTNAPAPLEAGQKLPRFRMHPLQEFRIGGLSPLSSETGTRLVVKTVMAYSSTSPSLKSL
jgi:hypothetical protein